MQELTLCSKCGSRYTTDVLCGKCFRAERDRLGEIPKSQVLLEPKVQFPTLVSKIDGADIVKNYSDEQKQIIIDWMVDAIWGFISMRFYNPSSRYANRERPKTTWVGNPKRSRSGKVISSQGHIQGKFTAAVTYRKGGLRDKAFIEFYPDRNGFVTWTTVIHECIHATGRDHHHNLGGFKFVTNAYSDTLSPHIGKILGFCDEPRFMTRGLHRPQPLPIGVS